jgi:hypothetical protein
MSPGRLAPDIKPGKAEKRVKVEAPLVPRRSALNRYNDIPEPSTRYSPSSSLIVDSGFSAVCAARE